jgi:predicted HTH domain antitoxin
MAATLEIPEELLNVLGADPASAAEELRLLAAMKLFELGRVSSGTAARLAGMARVEFLSKLGDYGVSPFQMTPAELEQDLENAERAARSRTRQPPQAVRREQDLENAERAARRD